MSTIYRVILGLDPLRRVYKLVMVPRLSTVGQDNGPNNGTDSTGLDIFSFPYLEDRGSSIILGVPSLEVKQSLDQQCNHRIKQRDQCEK